MTDKDKSNLVIVESPAKAKTIEKYLGPGFKVMSSVGHIRAIATNKDLPKGEKAIDTEDGFKTQYIIDPEKERVVKDLQAAVKKAKTIWLATDEDREGESIAWHLCEVLNLDENHTNRIVFHEITKDAIETSVKNPRRVDMKMVEAQQARQILDRLVGFELSPVVWQKVPGGKSAGRVQSPAVRLLVEREREIRGFESKFVFKVSAIFKHGKSELKATLPKTFASEKLATEFLKKLVDADFTVANVTKSPGKRTPPTPFTTSTLQQEANAKLGFAARTTMSAAQKLYQSGQITYMRTDSVNLSQQFLAAAGEFIKKEFGENYHTRRVYKTKSAGAQEAHEAIRPTNPAKAVVTEGDAYAKKLYSLIRNRTLASQMAEAKIEKTVITINPQGFEAKGEVVIFDGFLKVYGKSKDDLLPDLAVGDPLKAEEIVARQTYERPPARYTEGSLVKELESRGIGRPSTYATIINTIQTRGYVLRGESEGEERKVTEVVLEKNTVSTREVTEKTGADKGKLVPTDIGMAISDFLLDHFNQVVDYDFTAKVEQELDDIAENKLPRNQMLEEFYQPFHGLIKNSGSIDRQAAAGLRELGVDPKTKLPVYARITRFGAALQLGDKDGEEKPKFAPLPKDARLETVTLEQALKMFELPRTVGKTRDGQEIIANIGRFGPYIKVGQLFISIKPASPFKITEVKANELYDEKLAAEAAKNIADFGDIKVLNGRFGPYVTNGSKNAKVPKEVDPKALDEVAARKLIEAAPAKKVVRRRSKRS
jgi:DNA topoisomerase-1